jgi:putative PEP-CTERM system TPR-repeat lipoprotein
MNRAIKAAPTTAKPRALLANFYLDEMHDPSKALATAQEALNAFPNDPDVLAALGAAQLALGQSDRALATLSKLAQQARDSAGAQYRLATAQVAVHDVVAARASLDRALTINPGLVEARALRGSLDLAAGRKTQALEAARAIQKSAPLMPAGYVLEGDVLMAERQFAQAEPKYAKALELDKNDQTVIRWHKAKSQAGGAAEANARLLAWVKEQPQDYEVRTYLASVYIAEGKYPAASAQLEAVVTGQPDNYQALNDLAALYQEEKDSRALATAERAYRLAPERPEIMDTLGWILVNQGDRNRGVRLLEQAADANGAPPDARFHLALALMKSGENARARRELERLLARKDQFPQRAEAEALLRKLPN